MGNAQAIALYGEEKTPVKTYLFYLINHDRNFIFSNTIQDVTTTANLLTITQGNKFPGSLMAFYKNVIKNVANYGQGAGLNVTQLAAAEFETSDVTTLTNLLTNGDMTP